MTARKNAPKNVPPLDDVELAALRRLSEGSPRTEYQQRILSRSEVVALAALKWYAAASQRPGTSRSVA
jgi:hypothetical protein